jgi:hypothetical protein
MRHPVHRQAENPAVLLQTLPGARLPANRTGTLERVPTVTGRGEGRPRVPTPPQTALWVGTKKSEISPKFRRISRSAELRAGRLPPDEIEWRSSQPCSAPWRHRPDGLRRGQPQQSPTGDRPRSLIARTFDRTAFRAGTGASTVTLATTNSGGATTDLRRRWPVSLAGDSSTPRPTPPCLSPSRENRGRTEVVQRRTARPLSSVEHIARRTASAAH